ncbi:putative glycosyltransferase EpsF [compost metagenome]
MFLGKRSDVPQLMQVMDVFLLPSFFEGLGIVLIEAQAAGLRCIASKKVPIEAKVTPNLHFVSDSISEWVQCTLQAANGYKRTNNSDTISKAGYDLRTQIKVIEKLYAGGNISLDCLSAEKDL